MRLRIFPYIISQRCHSNFGDHWQRRGTARSAHRQSHRRSRFIANSNDIKVALFFYSPSILSNGFVGFGSEKKANYMIDNKFFETNKQIRMLNFVSTNDNLMTHTLQSIEKTLEYAELVFDITVLSTTKMTILRI